MKFAFSFRFFDEYPETIVNYMKIVEEGIDLKFFIECLCNFGFNHTKLIDKEINSIFFIINHQNINFNYQKLIN